MNDFFQKLKRVLRKPPRFIFERILYEIKAECGRLWEPFYPKWLRQTVLLRKFNSPNINTLWETLGSKFYCTETQFREPMHYEAATGDSLARILRRAAVVMEHKVNLLGSGLIFLGEEINWSRDFKSGFIWQQQYFRSIAYTDLGKPNDVKVPWELSRMQWMIPLGQAYCLTQDESYAEKTKMLIKSWLKSNPFACSVNWACTMDVALRLIVWTWFFHVFKGSSAWQDPAFRWEFLQSLYLHGAFTTRHLEKSDVNGNHYTANAAGLLFAGLFFGKSSWESSGWQILHEEIQTQVHEDGVDFEASTPYHRLVQELFLLPALYRIKQGLTVPDVYRERLMKMAYFTACYSRLDGSIPIWGDGDDARVLPFGEQALNDHRYLIGLVGMSFDSKKLLDLWSGSNSEMFWIFGQAPSVNSQPMVQLSSEYFPHGGVYIMRDDKNHVFIDCGPIGLKGRGGHGHNDLMSFEAILDHTPLIVDCGSYVYTSDYLARNVFRSTGSHNTPQIDGEEINRFIRPDYIWNFHNDADYHVEAWQVQGESIYFRGTHSGYARLNDPVKPIRTIELNHTESVLTIEDVFEGEGEHRITIPFHLHPDVQAVQIGTDALELRTPTNAFILHWESSAPWLMKIEPAQVSPCYGVVQKAQKIVYTYEGKMGIGLKLRIHKEDQHYGT
ncbi:MAG: heparinase II/III family protein [Pseudomonadota bacterium]|nr:heparinase II/III family protein [Pseudomonadota bacterium]